MSGVEVVGLVLGALPLAIKAAKTYQAIISIKNAGNELGALVRDLETEQALLRDTCEHLLTGIAEVSQIDQLIEDPFGPAWEPYSEAIRLRLWTSQSAIESKLADMKSAALELKSKLSIAADGKPSLTGRASILRELKRNAAFTLKRKDYADVMSRIKHGNTALVQLVRSGADLEHTRRQRSQAKVTRLLRRLSEGIFDAVCKAMTCGCAISHSIGLELVARRAILLPSDVEDEVATRFTFHVALRSHYEAALVRWDGIYIRPAKQARPIVMASEPASPQPQKVQRRVLFRLNTHQTVSTLSSTATTATLGSQEEKTEIQNASSQTTLVATPPSVRNICPIALKNDPFCETGCYGYISTTERKFELYDYRVRQEFHVSSTLREVLRGTSNLQLQLKNLYLEKLRIARVLSASVLHLFRTRWIDAALTLDDVLLLCAKETVISPSQTGFQIFVSSPQSHKLVSLPRPMNVTVLSLGLLLIQVILAREIDTLDMTGTVDMESALSNIKAAKDFAGDMVELGGMEYSRAVTWCLDSFLGTKGLENDAFCQRFFEEVVAPLDDIEQVAAC